MDPIVAEEVRQTPVKVIVISPNTMPDPRLGFRLALATSHLEMISVGHYVSIGEDRLDHVTWQRVA